MKALPNPTKDDQTCRRKLWREPVSETLASADLTNSVLEAPGKVTWLIILVLKPEPPLKRENPENLQDVQWQF
jgi:hypothetical protein